MNLNRKQRADLASETLHIIELGSYTTALGQIISIREEIERAVSGTVLYRPDDFPNVMPASGNNPVQTRIEVTGETTLEAAARLHNEGESDIAVLNFASANNPGGGFISGSQAQEESLARSSALYPCLMSLFEMHEHNRQIHSGFYSDHMIYSPGVPVFRSDSVELLDTPYPISVISAPAVNAGAVKENNPASVHLIEETMRRRMARVLWLAQQHKHSTLILGAWGCGVFANDPASVARLFAEQLSPPSVFHGQFKRIVFAVYDRSGEILNAFNEELACLSDM